MKKMIWVLGMSLGLVTSASLQAAQFAAKHQLVNLELTWPSDLKPETVNVLNTLHAPKKIELYSLEMESGKPGYSLTIHMAEIIGTQHIDRSITVEPSVMINKFHNVAEIMDVTAVIAPNGQHSTREITLRDDVGQDNEGDEYYFVLKFQSNGDFGYVSNTSFSLVKNHWSDAAPNQLHETEILKYKAQSPQMELNLGDNKPTQRINDGDLETMPLVVNDEASLGEKTLKTRYRFIRHLDNVGISMSEKDLDSMKVPTVLDLATIKVTAGLLGAKVYLPMTDVGANKTRDEVVGGDKVFTIDPQSRKAPLKFSHDLKQHFDFGPGDKADGTVKYVLTLEFHTTETFSAVSNPTLVVTRIFKGEGAGLQREVVGTYDLDTMDYEQPIQQPILFP